MIRPGDADDEDDDRDSDSGADESQPLVETHTHATVQGIVRTTVTQATPSAEPEESMLAVGIEAHVLPGKDGPHGASAPKVFEDRVEGVKARATEGSTGGGAGT